MGSHATDGLSSPLDDKDRNTNSAMMEKETLANGPDSDSPQNTSGAEDNDEAFANGGRREAQVDDFGHPVGQTATNTSIAATMSLPHEVAFVAIICSAQFFTQTGLVQTLAILHIVGDSLGITDDAELSWLIAGYSLTVGTFILFSGRLGDLFGYKRMLLIGFLWFALWSLIAGCAVYAPGHILFVICRVLQGIGPAFCLPNALAILGATYPPGRRKAMVFSLFGATAPSGAVVGAVFASIIAEFAWWPWSFWVLACALVGVAAAGFWVIPDPPHRASLTFTPDQPKWRTVSDSLDLPGTFVGVAALVLFNFAWNQAPLDGWQSADIIATLIIGLALFGAFMYIELYVSPQPLIPFHALTADVTFVLATVACGWSCFGVWIYYSWQWMTIVLGNSPLLSSAWFAPCPVSGIIAGISTGILLDHVRPAVVMTIALSAFTIGSILLATIPVGQIYWAQFFVCVIIMPFGMDMSFPAGTLILSDAVKSKKEQGIAASLVNTCVNYSISLGVAIAATVEVHTNKGGRTMDDLIHGYRSALWVSVGLAGMGLIICIIFIIKTHGKPVGTAAAVEDDSAPSEK